MLKKKVKTLIIIKSDKLINNFLLIINNIIIDNNFKILHQKHILLNEKTSKYFQIKYKKEKYYKNIFKYMLKSSIFIQVIEGLNVIYNVKKIIKYCSLCINFILKNIIKKELVYFSDYLHSSKEEISFFFSSHDIC